MTATPGGGPPDPVPPRDARTRPEALSASDASSTPDVGSTPDVISTPDAVSGPPAEQEAVRREALWRDWREMAGLIRTWPPMQTLRGWWGEDDPERPTPWWLRLIALVVAVWLGLLLALFAAFLTPYRIHGLLVPVSLVFVVAGLTAMARFTFAVTRHVWLSVLPGVVWLIVSLILSSRTREGDLVLTQRNWVATVYLLLGSVTLGVLTYRMVVPRPESSTAQPRRRDAARTRGADRSARKGR